MSRKSVFVLVTMLLLTPALVFATGSSEETAAGATGDGPQYGGTFTYFGYPQDNEPGSPSINDANHGSLVWLEPIQERPIHGAVEQFGPRGNGEYAFQLVAYIPPAYQTGHLISDWEVTLERMVWTVRDGVVWQSVPGVMESRPLTAQDIADDVQRFVDSPWGNRFDGILASIEVQGNQIIFEYENYSPELFYWIGYEDRAIISPPETTAAGDTQWENQGGTGAFKFEEYVVGSYMSYVRNDDYWDTTVIDGTEYQMPFVDRVVKPIIPDTSTQVAALTTGQIDWMGVGADQWDLVERTAPELERNFYGDMVRALYFNLGQEDEPWADRDVRRALMIGTNFDVFRSFGEAENFPVHVYPAWSGNPSVYTPMEELPANVRELYDYDPEEAMELLAEAGYPNGFDITYTFINQGNLPDFAALLQDEWGKIGVNVILNPVEATVYNDLRESRTWDGVTNIDTQIGNATGSVINLLASDGFLNYSNYSNAEVDRLSAQIASELDSEVQNRLIKEAAVIAAADVPQIGLFLMPQGDFWWPWVRNYYGEHSIEDGTFGGLKPYLWIDESMKRQMGF